MILGIGCDLLHVSRIPALAPEDPFFRRGFTEREQQEALASGDYRRRFASDFAGKEAVYKALHGVPDRFRSTEIEILRSETGEPYVTLHGNAAAHAAALGIRQVQISLSWETDYCMAFAAAVGGDDENALHGE